MTAVTESRARRVTPTAFLVTSAPPHTPEWHGARSGGIGSSDIPPIIGESEYATALDVYLDKHGVPPTDELGEAGEWGLALEDTIARVWAERTGFAVQRVGILAHVESPHHRAAVDRLVRGCPDGRCALEIKTRNAWVAGRWRDDVPDDVQAQALWQRYVTGLDHIHVACLVGGQKLVQHVVERDDAIEAYLVDEADRVWDCVQAGTPPDVDPSAVALRSLDRLHGERDGAAEVNAREALDLIDAYRTAHAVEKNAAREKDAAKAALVALLGPADTGLVAGAVAFTYRPSARLTPDLERLKVEFPDAYAACVARKPTRPVFRLGREFAS